MVLNVLNDDPKTPQMLQTGSTMLFEECGGCSFTFEMFTGGFTSSAKDTLCSENALQSNLLTPKGWFGQEWKWACATWSALLLRAALRQPQT